MNVRVTISSDNLPSWHEVVMTEQEANTFISYLGRSLTPEEVADPKMTDHVHVSVQDITETA